MKIKQTASRISSAAPRQVSKSKFASHGTNIPESYDDASFNGKNTTSAGQRPKSGTHNEITNLPDSTTRALDPDYHFHHGFLMDNPGNRQEHQRSLYSTLGNPLPQKNHNEEKINDFWNFKGPSSISQNRDFFTNPLPPKSIQTAANGSNNNIKRVFQKAHNKRSSSHDAPSSMMHRDHNLVRGMHRHSDDRLARDLVNFEGPRSSRLGHTGTKSFASARSNQQHAASRDSNASMTHRSIAQAKPIAAHLASGMFCQECLFQKESCSDCLRSNGLPVKQLPKAPVFRSTSRTRTVQNQSRGTPAHLEQGNFCETCLFSDHACSSCLAVEQTWNRAQSKFASRLSDMESARNRPHTRVTSRGPPAHIVNGTFCQVCLFSNDACSDCNPSIKVQVGSSKSARPAALTKLPNSPYAVTWKRSPASPFHIASGAFCATCLFENIQCTDCFGSSTGSKEDMTATRPISSTRPASSKSKSTAKSNQSRAQDKRRIMSPSDDNWRRTQDSQPGAFMQQTSWSNGQWNQNTASYTNGAFEMNQRSAWQPSSGSTSNNRQQVNRAGNHPAAVASADMIEIDWVNVIPKGFTSQAAGARNGSSRSNPQQSRNECSVRARDRPQIPSNGYVDPNFEADHSGVMRPNKTYVGRPKQTHCDSKSKRPKHYF